MQFLKSRALALVDSGAWLMIVLGLLLFSSRVQFSADGWVNLPIAASFLQIAGGIFVLFGLQIMASIIMWPTLNTETLYADVREGKTASAYVLLGMLIFNGLCMIGFVIWLNASLSIGGFL